MIQMLSDVLVSVYTVKESSFCHTDDKIAKHVDLEEAQAACSAMGEECKSITSYGCSGDYIWTCSAAPREPSTSGSCSWIKGKPNTMLFFVKKRYYLKLY